MRARSLKPGLFKNEYLGGADPLVTLLFEGLWCLADREGRLEDRPARIKAEVFPYRETVNLQELNGYLTQLERWEFIRRYQAGGKKVVEIVNFKKHQNPHHTEKKSILPAPPDSPLFNGEPPEGLQEIHGEGTVNILLTPDSRLLTPDPGLLTPESLNPNTPTSANGGEGAEVKAETLKQKFNPISVEVLGVLADPVRWGSTRNETWADVASLVDGYGLDAVLEKFEAWARDHMGEHISRPVQKFLEVAPGMFQGSFVSVQSPEIVNLLEETAAISDNEVLFDDKQKVKLGQLLKTYTREEILEAFREFYAKVQNDDFELRRGGRLFAERAEQALLGLRRRKLAEEKRRRDDEEALRVALANREKINANNNAEENGL